MDLEYKGVSTHAEGRERRSRRPCVGQRSIAGNNIWRRIQGYSHWQPLRLPGNCGRSSVGNSGSMKNQNLNLCVRVKFHPRPFCPLRWPPNQKRHALFKKKIRPSRDGALEFVTPRGPPAVLTPRGLTLDRDTFSTGLPWTTLD